MDLRNIGIMPLRRRLRAGTGSLANFANLAGDTRGNILPLVAGGLVLVATMIGGGVDMSRSYMAKSRLQAACDAATLAGRRAVSTNGYDTAAKAQATSYFNVNYDETREKTHGTWFTSSSTDSGNRVNGTARTIVDMLVMKMLGYRTITIDVTCTSTMGVGNSDVTMVLDVTSSMDQTLAGSNPSQTRIQALRAAMKNFYTTVKTATTGSNARIRYAFVPYSSTVNVGRLLDASYIRSSWPIQSRVAVYRTDTSQVPDGYGTPVTGTPTVTYNYTGGTRTAYNSTTYTNSGTGLNSCNSARPASTAWTNNGSSSTPAPTVVIDGSGNQVTTTTKTQPQKTTTEYVCELNTSSTPKYQIYKYTNRTRNEVTTTVATAAQVYKTVSVQVFDHWDFKQITYDTSVYKTFQAVTKPTGETNKLPANVTSTWNGCIEERKSSASATFSYSTLLGMSPDVNDLDLDLVPDTDPDTQWAPMWPSVTYVRKTSNGSLSNAAVTNVPPDKGFGVAASYCPTAAKLLTSMTQTEFNAYTDTVAGGGYTYHDIGMIWGGRLASPDGIFGSTVNIKPTNGASVARHLIFMTDGEMCPFNTVLSAYGIEYNDRRVTTDGGSTLFCDDAGNDATYKAYAARHTARFKAVCDAIKAKGIRVWVIVFATATTSDMTYCASSNSSFTASNSTQLNSAFQEIAKQVGELRVVD